MKELSSIGQGKIPPTSPSMPEAVPPHSLESYWAALIAEEALYKAAEIGGVEGVLFMAAKLRGEPPPPTTAPLIPPVK